MPYILAETYVPTIMIIRITTSMSFTRKDGLLAGYVFYAAVND